MPRSDGNEIDFTLARRNRSKNNYIKGIDVSFNLIVVLGKRKSIKMSPDRWSNYFLTLNEQFVNRYVAVVYGISAVLSAYIAYLLFKVFGFHRPVFNAVILAVVCAVLSGIRYRKKGKKQSKRA